MLARFALVPVLAVVALLAVAAIVRPVSAAQDDAPKPGVTVKGTAIYNGVGRDNMTMTLTPEPTEKDKSPKAITTMTTEKGQFEFKSVPVGKYKLTAKGKPTNSLRKLRELDPVDVHVESATGDAITADVKLTTDK